MLEGEDFIYWIQTNKNNISKKAQTIEDTIDDK